MQYTNTFKQLFGELPELAKPQKVPKKLQNLPLKEFRNSPNAKSYYSKCIDLCCADILISRFRKIMEEKGIEPTDEFCQRVFDGTWYSHIPDPKYTSRDEDGYINPRGTPILREWLNLENIFLPEELALTKLEEALGCKPPHQINTLHSAAIEGNKKLFLLGFGYLNQNMDFTVKAANCPVMVKLNAEYDAREKERQRQIEENKRMQEKAKKQKEERREAGLESLEDVVFGVFEEDKLRLRSDRNPTKWSDKLKAFFKNKKGDE